MRYCGQLRQRRKCSTHREEQSYEQCLSHRHEFTLSINGTTSPSLIPYAHDSVLPYLAMPPQLLQQRVPPLQDERGVFGMTFFPDKEGYKERIEYKNEDDVVGYMSPRW